MRIKYIIILLITLTVLLSSSVSFCQQWVLAGSVSNPGVRPSISMIDKNNCWIADGTADTAKIFRTTNGGLNWVSIPTSGITHEIYCLWLISPDNCMVGEGVVSGNARIFRTTDAGLNWSVTAQTNPNQGYFNGICFPRINAATLMFGIAVAERIYKTSDYGATWQMIQSGVNGVSNAQNSLMIIDRNFFGFGMNNGAARIRLTQDNGNSWVNLSVGIIGSNTCAIAYKEDKLFGVAATSTSLPYISRTTDGGTTWNAVNVGPGPVGDCKIKWILGSNVVYLMGNNGKISRSLDNGLTWDTMRTAGVTGLTHFDFIKATENVIYGYAVSSDGRVIKLADSVIILTGANKNNNSLPHNYSLSQNYPNPFNPTTVINYQLPHSNNVKLSVFDVLGREVAVLVNEKQEAGNHEVTFDGINYSSGIYFYKISAGSFTETKKMILTK